MQGGWLLNKRLRTPGHTVQEENTEEVGRALRLPFSKWGSRKPQHLQMKTRSHFDSLPTQAGPVGAQLRLFAQVWVENYSDRWVTSTVLQGHLWKFSHRPPRYSFLPTKIPSSKEKKEILFQYVQILLHQQAIVLVPDSEKFSGFYSLFPSLFSTQKVGRMETCVGSETVKQKHSSGALQDGVSKYSNIVSKARGLNGLHRSPRCVPSHTCSSRFPTFSPVQNRQTSPPVLMPSFWNFGSPPRERDMGPTLSGPISDPIPAQGSYGNTLTRSCKHIDQIWMADQLFIRSTYLYSKDDIPWGVIQHPGESSVTSAGKDLYVIGESKEGNGKQVHASIGLPEFPGIPFFMYPDGKVGQVESTGIPTGVPISVEKEAPRPGDTDHTNNEVQSPTF